MTCYTILRTAIYITLVIIPTVEVASAQADLKAIRGGENSLRSEEEKKNDRAVDRAYQSTIKRLPDQEKKKSDPWGDVRSAPAAKDK